MKRRFQRKLGERRYKKLFVISTEGAKTEPEYFKLLQHENVVLKVLSSKGGLHNSPLHVLKRMEQYLQKNPLRKTDEAWIVIDKDQWSDEQIMELHRWAKKSPNRGLAVSTPKFELLLLKHYEHGFGTMSSHECTARLKQYFPTYDKGIPAGKFSLVEIQQAIHRAKQRDNPPCKEWPRATGTTVYRLLEKILLAHGS